jgi:hypothetical protein
MRFIMLLPVVLVPLSMTGCTSPMVIGASTDEIVIRHLAAVDDAKSLQAQADSECDKFGKKAHFDRYEDETLLGPRNAYFYCDNPVTAAQ